MWNIARNLVSYMLVASVVSFVVACGVQPTGGVAPSNPVASVPPPVTPERLHVELGLTNGETRFDMSLFGPVTIWSGLQLAPVDGSSRYPSQVSLVCNGQLITPTSVRTGSVFGPNRELVLELSTYRKPESDCAVTLGADFAAANGTALGVETTFAFHVRSLPDQFERLGHKLGKPERPRLWNIVFSNGATKKCPGFDVAQIASPHVVILVCSGDGSAYTVDEARGDVGTLDFFRASYGGEFVNFITTDEYTIE